MKTAIFSALAIGTSISVALADPMPSADHANDGVTTEAASQGPVALTEAEMDQVAAGGRLGDPTVFYNIADQNDTVVQQKKWLPLSFRIQLGDLP